MTTDEETKTLVERLRGNADSHGRGMPLARRITGDHLSAAADTIEALSAKVAELTIQLRVVRLDRDGAVKRMESAEKRLAEAEAENAALLQSAAAKGDEPDLLIIEWRNALARAERAEEAFGIAKADSTRLESALRSIANWRPEDGELEAFAKAALSAPGPDVVKETARRCVDAPNPDDPADAINREFLSGGQTWPEDRQ